jgi:membrane-bound inhibitor of C-type lysozyme
MKGMMLVALAAMAVAGCATGDDGARTVRFTCDRGPALSVRFDADSATITQDGLDPITLPQARAASGFLYQSATHSLRGKGREVQWTIGRMAPITCQQTD